MQYSPGMVVALLGVAFDPGRGWGAWLKDSSEPDPGMPRSASDPSSAGNLWAMCADVQRAFVELPKGPARNRVWCKYVEGHTVADIAAAEGVACKTVENTLYRCVRDMCEFLNGEPWVDPKAGA